MAGGVGIGIGRDVGIGNHTNATVYLRPGGGCMLMLLSGVGFLRDGVEARTGRFFFSLADGLCLQIPVSFVFTTFLPFSLISRFHFHFPSSLCGWTYG